MNKKDRDFLICFSSHYAIGPKTLKVIMDFGPERVWKNGLVVGETALSKNVLKAIEETRQKVDSSSYLKKLDDLGIKTLIYNDKGFPALLKETGSPPIVIYYLGDMNLENSIAIVGSRRCSYYAKLALNKILPDVVSCNISTVSGMAIGVDSLVHRITLECGGKTIAVLGSGLDVVYPFTNKKLFLDIEKSGAVISEFGLGMPPLKQNFPQRNRIVAGLAKSLLVVEADVNSGSLITARYALDFNRQVYAIPGDIGRAGSRGTNNLIKLGAKPVTEALDILIDYGLNSIQANAYLPKNEFESKIYKVFDSKPLYIDKICELTKLDIVTVNQYLTIMELSGVVENLGNSNYLKKL